MHQLIIITFMCKRKIDVNLLINLLISNVAPEYHASPEHVVQRRSRFGVIDNRNHLVMIQADLPDVKSPCEK